jgi:hypothetical protein
MVMLNNKLRPRRERPRCCGAAESQDELAPLHLRTHSVTSSARSRNCSTPNHLNIYVLERDYDINPRFSAFIGFVLHGYAHNGLRIFCARLRPFALNNFRLFDLSKQTLHEYPS